MSKGKEILDMVFIPDNNSSEIMHPGKEAFNTPASTKTSKGSAILSRRFSSVLSMRGNKFNTLVSKHLIQWVTVVGPISDQSDRLLINETFLESIPDKGDFMRRSRRSVQGDRKNTGHFYLGKNRTFLLWLDRTA